MNWSGPGRRVEEQAGENRHRRAQHARHRRGQAHAPNRERAIKRQQANGAGETGNATPG
jgi:hypothetical protein